MANQPSIKRTSEQLTVEGLGRFQPVTTPGIRSIPTGLTPGQQVIPHHIVGIDNVDVSIHFNLLNQGTGATKTGTATFSNLSPVLTGTGDTLKLHCHMTIDNPIGNLAISGYSITPQMKDNTNLTNAVNVGPNLSGIRQTSLYQASISITVIAVNNAPAGDVVCHCLAYLALQPG